MFAFFEFNCTRLRQPLTTEHCGSVHYITIGDSRLLTAAGLTRSPLYLIGDAASRCGLSRVGYFIPLSGRCPFNGHPPSSDYKLAVLFLISSSCVLCSFTVLPQGSKFMVANATMFFHLLPGCSCGSKHLLLPKFLVLLI